MSSRAFAVLAAAWTLALTAGCQEYAVSGTQALNGVYRSVVSDPGKAHATGEMLALDGLMLGYDLDRGGYYSASVDSYGGDIEGRMDSRGPDGGLVHSYRLTGVQYDDASIELQETGGYRDGGRVSLFRNAAISDDSFARHELEGLYAMYGPDFDATLSIDAYGHIEGYDEYGCGYFGRISSPDAWTNVHEVSMDVDGCGGDYAVGLATLDRTTDYADELVVTLWFDRDDRVEAWVMQRQ